MSGQWFTPVGEIHSSYSPQHKRYNDAITDAMCAEHDWLTTVTAF